MDRRSATSLGMLAGEAPPPQEKIPDSRIRIYWGVQTEVVLILPLPASTGPPTSQRVGDTLGAVSGPFGSLLETLWKLVGARGSPRTPFGVPFKALGPDRGHHFRNCIECGKHLALTRPSFRFPCGSFCTAPTSCERTRPCRFAPSLRSAYGVR